MVCYLCFCCDVTPSVPASFHKFQFQFSHNNNLKRKYESIDTYEKLNRFQNRTMSNEISDELSNSISALLRRAVEEKPENVVLFIAEHLEKESGLNPEEFAKDYEVSLSEHREIVLEVLILIFFPFIFKN